MCHAVIRPRLDSSSRRSNADVPERGRRYRSCRCLYSRRRRLRGLWRRPGRRQARADRADPDHGELALPAGGAAAVRRRGRPPVGRENANRVQRPLVGLAVAPSRGGSHPRRRGKEGRPRIGRESRLGRCRHLELQRVARAAPRRQLRAAGRGPREWYPRRDAQGPRATPPRRTRNPAEPAAQAPRGRAAAHAARKLSRSENRNHRVSRRT